MRGVKVNPGAGSALRSARWIRAVLCMMVAAGLAACEPIGPIPGKRIDGIEAAVPSDWHKLDVAEVVQLETAAQYSVNLWGVGIDEGYFVAASRGPETRWAKQIGRDPDVRLRVGDSIYDLQATPVTDQAVLARIAAAYKSKYDLEARSDFPDAVIFRLGPR